MNIKIFLSTLVMGLCFIACSDDNVSETEKQQEGKPTYVNLSVSLPGRTTSRALPGDYNNDGTYEGLDSLQTLDVYMQSADGTVEAKRFTGLDISHTGTVVSPSQPFRTTSGYKTIYIVINNPNPLGTVITTEHDLIATDNLAQVVTANGKEYDLITMTGKSANVYIQPDVPIQDVAKGSNKIAVSVDRMASRVIVTTTASADLIDENGEKIGSVSDVNFSVAQGTNKIYWLSQPNYVSYGSEYVPALGEYAGQADTYYDYSNLSVKNAIPQKPVDADGYKALKGQFLFENTHTEGNLESTQYRKGNTAYILVRAKFTPEANAIADGGSLTGGTFYVGQTDGKIYSSKQAALAAFPNQKVATYVGGNMINYAWLNPDDLVKPLNSPVLRNNIYHVNITGFKRLSYNWNPLFPEDPNTANPQNPDPKPGPEEPEIPIDPVDPLTPEQTNMSVEVNVLQWTTHSYDIEF